MGGLAYVERDRRWLQQSAKPDQRFTDRFVTGEPVTGSPTPLSGSAFELTEDCRASRNARHLPHSLLRPSLPFSRSNQHSVLDTAVPGTLFARWRTGGAVLLCPVPAAYRLPCGASCYATGLPRVFQPCFGKFFFEAVIGLSEAAGGTLAAWTHTTTRAVTKVA